MSQGLIRLKSLLLGSLIVLYLLLGTRWQQQRLFLQQLSVRARQDVTNLSQHQADRNRQEQRTLLSPQVLNAQLLPITIEPRRATGPLKRCCRRTTMRLRTSRKHHEEAPAKIDHCLPVLSHKDIHQAINGTTIVANHPTCLLQLRMAEDPLRW